MRPGRCRWWVIVLVIGFNAVGYGGPPDGSEQRIALPALLAEAEQNNPEIQSMRAFWRAAQARPSQLSSLPDPMLALSYRNARFNDLTLGTDPMSNLMVSFSQPVPFPGKLRLRGEVAERDAERIEQLARGVEWNVKTRLKVAYYDLYLVYKSIDIIQRDKDILERFEQTAEARYAVGQAIQQDVFKAQVEISRLMEKLNLLDQQREILVATINELLNRPPFNPLGRPIEVSRRNYGYSLETLNQMALEGNPTLQASDRLVVRSQTDLKLARMSYLPDFKLSANWGNRGGLSDIWQVQIGAQIPLYFWRKQRYQVDERASRLEQAQRHWQDQHQKILARVKHQHEIASVAQRNGILLESVIIPQAGLSLESARAGYAVGKVDFLTLLNNLITLLNDELDYYREVVRLEKAVAQLEELTGQPLE